MIFSITDLLDDQESIQWVEKYFHPQKLRCPGCGATSQQARAFRSNKRGFVDYHYLKCQRSYNLYTGTIFAGSNLAPRRVVLLVRGVCKGEPSTVLAEELGLCATVCASLAPATTTERTCAANASGTRRR